MRVWLLLCAALLTSATRILDAQDFSPQAKKIVSRPFSRIIFFGGVFDGILKHKKLFVLELCDV